MRSLRNLAFLLVVLGATVALASGPAGAQQSPAAPQAALTQDAHGNFQFNIALSAQPREFALPPAEQSHNVEEPKRFLDGSAAGAVRDALNRDNTCYFIRSYIMKREGRAGATHLDRVETCTPMSQIRTRRTFRMVPAFAR